MLKTFRAGKRSEGSKSSRRLSTPCYSHAPLLLRLRHPGHVLRIRYCIQQRKSMNAVQCLQATNGHNGGCLSTSRQWSITERSTQLKLEAVALVFVGCWLSATEREATFCSDRETSRPLKVLASGWDCLQSVVHTHTLRPRPSGSYLGPG